MAIDDINNPQFLSERNMLELAEDARYADYGPGVNEELYAAQQASAAVREAASANAGYDPLAAAAPPAPFAGDAGEAAAERIAELAMQKLMDKLGKL